MSWARNNHKENQTFSYTCRDWNGDIYEEKGGFTDYRDCEAAAQDAERRMTIEMLRGLIDQEIAVMSDDEILKELGI